MLFQCLPLETQLLGELQQRKFQDDDDGEGNRRNKKIKKLHFKRQQQTTKIISLRIPFRFVRFVSFGRRILKILAFVVSDWVRITKRL